MKVTLDTNILVSATFWTGDSFRILQLIDEGSLTCILSPQILAEYEKAIHSEDIIDKVYAKRLILQRIVDRVMERATIVRPKKKLNIVTEDPDDNKILECAKEAKANYIITQDKHLLKIKTFEGMRIITPFKFLQMKSPARPSPRSSRSLGFLHSSYRLP